MEPGAEPRTRGRARRWAASDDDDNYDEMSVGEDEESSEAEGQPENSGREPWTVNEWSACPPRVRDERVAAGSRKVSAAHTQSSSSPGHVP